MTMKPVRDLLVKLSPVKSASTKARMNNSLPNGGGPLLGMGSLVGP